MEPQELFDDELELEGEDWDEDTLALEEDEADPLSLARELGVPLGR